MPSLSEYVYAGFEVGHMYMLITCVRWLYTYADDHSHPAVLITCICLIRLLYTLHMVLQRC